MASPGSGEPMSARKIQDLRVIDLKAQLEQRGIERTGVKASLIDRLKKALEDEGQNPEEYVFEIDMKKANKTDVKDKDKDDDELEELTEMTDMENGEADQTLTEDTPLESMETTPTTEPAVTTEVLNPPPESLNLGDELILDMEGDQSEAVVKMLDDGEATEEAMPIITTEEPILPETADDEADDEKDVEASISEQPATGEHLPIEKMADAEKIADPPSPSSVPVIAPFTKDDLFCMDTSGERQMDEDLSLIVHIDESQMDLDNDLLNTPAKQLTTGSKSAEEDGNTTPDAENQGSGAAEADDATPTKAIDSSEKVETGSGNGTTPDAATSTNDQKTSQSKDGDKAKSTGAKPDAKDGKAKAVPPSSRNLWISGLASSTRATDLKTLFTKYGKVAGAKVVTNAKSPGSRCYGFVTMTTADEASKCIQHLHRTELHGKMISVERAKNDPSAQAKIAPKPGAVTSQKKDESSRDRRDDHDRRSGGGGSHRLSGRLGDRDRDRDRNRERDRRTSGPRSHSRRSPGHRSPGSAASSRDTKDKDIKDKDSKDSDAKDNKDNKDNKDLKDKKDVLDFEKIKAERERERLKQRERQMREDERRRMRELERMRDRQHDVERRQREEAVRLEREKQRLRLEQQKLERERLEAERERIILERERQRRERERLEKEREQERQLQMRLEQERRAMKRNYDSRGVQRDEYWNDQKRPNLDRNARYEDSKSGGDGFERRVERYDRRDGRPVDAAIPRTAGERFEGRRDDRHESRRQSGGPPRQPGGPPRQPGIPPRQQGGPPRDNRDRDDRGRPAAEDRSRNDRFSERRDGPPRDGPPATRPPPSRDHDRPRHDRDRSPHGPVHHGTPARTSPSHRQPTSRDDWKSERNSVPTRDGRGRGGAGARPAPAGDRGYAEDRAPATRDAGSWHGSRAGNPTAQAERSKPHSYNAGPGLLGTAPGSMDHQWNSNDRSTVAAAAMSSRPTDRGWVAPPSQTTDRVSVRPQPAAMVAQQPLLQTPPSSAAFLASAANIMMGVGLASNRGATQDTRYDAYKTLQGGNVRRY